MFSSDFGMMKKSALIFLLFLLLKFLGLIPPLCGSSLSSNPESPSWWGIKLILATDGEYKLEEGESVYSGSYSFTIIWTGSIERDNSDYLLYRLDCKLSRWEVQEKAALPGFLRLLTTADFIDQPCFSLNYLLKKDKNLHFDFIVEGFMVPQNESFEKFYLNLPASEENSEHSSPVNYDSFVVKGSNSVFLEEKEIYLAPVEKKYSWTWKHQEWLLRQNKVVFTSNSHKVKVGLSLTPHF